MTDNPCNLKKSIFSIELLWELSAAVYIIFVAKAHPSVSSHYEGKSLPPRSTPCHFLAFSVLFLFFFLFFFLYRHTHTQRKKCGVWHVPSIHTCLFTSWEHSVSASGFEPVPTGSYWVLARRSHHLATKGLITFLIVYSTWNSWDWRPTWHYAGHTTTPLTLRLQY